MICDAPTAIVTCGAEPREANHCERAREDGRDVAPHEVCLGKTVQQENGRARPGPAYKDRGVAGVDFGASKMLHDGASLQET